jgi:hypothetical protein
MLWRKVKMVHDKFGATSSGLYAFGHGMYAIVKHLQGEFTKEFDEG